MLVIACNNDEPAPAKRTPSIAPTQTPVVEPEPQFVQEGVLEIFSPDAKRKIERFDIEIAHNDTERAKGMMFRKTLLPNHGMLFVFNTEEPQSFWMRNTFLPLDIIYLDKEGNVVSIQKNCKILNDNPLPSEKPAMYVLEINGGLSDNLGITIGSKAMWRDFVTQKNRGNVPL
jgi:uncharacterized membrane protein (UPF0127 family)